MNGLLKIGIECQQNVSIKNIPDEYLHLRYIGY